MRTGFEDNHRPLKALPETRKNGLMLMNIWSLKGNGRPISIEGELTADAWTHFETNPSIERISSYPVLLPYHTVDSDGFVEKHEHVPDIGVRYRPRDRENQGRIVYIDVMSLAMQKKTKWVERKLNALKRGYTDRYNAGYGVLSELDLLVEPRMTNMRTIERHLFASVEPEKAIVRRLIKDLRVATIAQLRETSGIKSPWWEVYGPESRVTYQRELVEVDKTFTSVMQLAAAGEVAFNMDAPITDGSLITYLPIGGGY